MAMDVDDHFGGQVVMVRGVVNHHVLAMMDISEVGQVMLLPVDLFESGRSIDVENHLVVMALAILRIDPNPDFVPLAVHVLDDAVNRVAVVRRTGRGVAARASRGGARLRGARELCRRGTGIGPAGEPGRAGCSGCQAAETCR